MFILVHGRASLRRFLHTGSVSNTIIPPFGVKAEAFGRFGRGDIPSLMKVLD